MNVIATMGAVAVLFVIFGLLGTRRGCGHGGGCAGCGATCRRSSGGEEGQP